MVDFRINVVVSPTQARRGIKSVQKDLTSLEKAATRVRTTIRTAFQFDTAGLRAGSTAVRNQFKAIERQANMTRRVVRGAVSFDAARARTGARSIQRELQNVSRTASGVRRNLQGATRIDTTRSRAQLRDLRRDMNLVGSTAAQTGRIMRSSLVVNPAGVRRGAGVVRSELASVAAVGTRVRTILAGAFGLVGVTLGIQGIFGLVDAYTNLQNRIRTVTSGEQELATVSKEVLDIAVRTRSAFDSTTEVYARTALAAKELGRTQQELLQFTESLNQAVILSGAGAEEARNALIQLSQGIASGALRGDELRSVLEQLPTVADVIARHLGVTRGELRLMGAEGKISAEIILDAFKEAREELEERFGKTVPTLGQSFQVLRTELVRYVGGADSATGATAALGAVIQSLARNLDFLLPLVIGLGAAFATRLALGVGASILQFRTLSFLLSASPYIALAIAVAFLARSFIDMGSDAEESASGIGLVTASVRNTKAAIEELASVRGELVDARAADDAEARIEGIRRQLDLLKQFAEGEFATLDISPRALQAIVPEFDAQSFLREFPDQLVPADRVQKEVRNLVSTLEEELSRVETIEAGAGALQGFFAELEEQQALVRETGREQRILEAQFRALGAAAQDGSTDVQDLAEAFDRVREEVIDLEEAVARSQIRDLISDLDQSNEDLLRRQAALQFGGERLLAQEEALISARAVASKQGSQLTLEEINRISELAGENYDLQKAIESVQEAREGKSTASFESSLAALRDEADLLRLSNREREVTIDLRRTEQDLARAGVDLTDTQRQVLADQIRSNQALADQNAIVEQVTGAQRELEHAQRALSAGYADGRLSLEQYENALLGYQIRALEANTDVASGVERAFLQIQLIARDHASLVQNTIVTAYESATDAIADFVASGFRDLTSLQQAASQIFAQITADLAKLAIQQGLASLTQPTATATAGQGSTSSTVSSILGILTTALAGAETGTLDARKGRPLIVGEGGPEVFTPRTSGSILPNSKLAEMAQRSGGGGGQAEPAQVNVSPVLNVKVDNGLNESAIASRVLATMDSRQGQDKLVENIGKNKRKVRQVTS